ncbi:unknown [Bacteroides sp. CAG:633]|nr:unknown [Bacteroides sp. CAG:633]
MAEAPGAVFEFFLLCAAFSEVGLRDGYERNDDEGSYEYGHRDEQQRGYVGHGGFRSYCADQGAYEERSQCARQ